MSNTSESSARGNRVRAQAPGFNRVLRSTGVALIAWSHTRANRRAARRAVAVQRIGILDPDAPEAVRRTLTVLFRR